VNVAVRPTSFRKRDSARQSSHVIDYLRRAGRRIKSGALNSPLTTSAILISLLLTLPFINHSLLTLPQTGDNTRARSSPAPMIGVKETVSKHSVSLEPRILSELLRLLIEDDKIPITVGKKRRAEDADTHTDPSKRQKFTDLTNGIWAQVYDEQEASHKVIAFKHTYDFALTLSPAGLDNRDTPTPEPYRKEVEVLKETLSLCSKSSIISDRGDIVLPVTVKTYSPDYYLRCSLDLYLSDSRSPFLTLLADHPPGRLGSGDFYQMNPIGAAHLLGIHNGVDFTFSVRLRPTLDPDHSPAHALPLKISVDMEGSLCFPQIAHPPKNTYRGSYCDAWNALTKHLFPSPFADVPNYRGETDIAFLYSILGPAHPLPSSISSADVQPKALLPSLLPFQRRSVLWMLQREGKTLDNTGNVVPFTPNYLPLFWESLELDGQNVYLNRLKEVLSLEPPPHDFESPGGSLNEAPGLGKTVECLALILLNPNIRRNPSVNRWDPEAKVHVREVRVSGYMLSILTFDGLFTQSIDRPPSLSHLLLYPHSGKTN
jgi:hypothetical protein